MLFASDAAIGYECRDFSVVPMDMKYKFLPSAVVKKEKLSALLATGDIL